MTEQQDFTSHPVAPGQHDGDRSRSAPDVLHRFPWPEVRRSMEWIGRAEGGRAPWNIIPLFSRGCMSVDMREIAY